MWVEDSQVAACQNCQAEFSVAKRRVSSFVCLLYKIYAAIILCACVRYTVELSHHTVKINWLAYNFN